MFGTGRLQKGEPREERKQVELGEDTSNQGNMMQVAEMHIPAVVRGTSKLKLKGGRGSNISNNHTENLILYDVFGGF